MEKLKLLKHSKKGFLNIKEKFKRKNIAICFFYKPFLKHKGTEKLKLKSEKIIQTLIKRDVRTNINSKQSWFSDQKDTSKDEKTHS